MAKYNLTETKEKKATYRSLVSPRLMDELKDKILDIILFQQKYKEKGYSAKKLAEDLNTNTRYISAVVNVRFHANYTSFVNKFRIEEAMTLLTDKIWWGLPTGSRSMRRSIGSTASLQENISYNTSSSIRLTR